MLFFWMETELVVAYLIGQLLEVRQQGFLILSKGVFCPFQTLKWF